MDDKTGPERSRLELAIERLETTSQALLEELRQFREPPPELIEERSEALHELAEAAEGACPAASLTLAFEHLIELDDALRELARLHRARLAEDALQLHRQREKLTAWEPALEPHHPKMDVSG